MNDLSAAQPEPESGAPDRDLRCTLFARMLRVRIVEETIAQRYHEQEMRCPVHLSIGQEAVAVGVCAVLETRDCILSTHRGHAHYLAKGGSLKAMIAEIYGKATGCAAGKGGSMHLLDLRVNMLGCTPIVGGSIPVAVGAAFAAWMLNDGRVTVVFFGEGATEEGVFFESLNFAALKRLPIVFVCENNLYSVYSPIEVRQPDDRDRVGLARALGVPGTRGDGNRVEAVFGAANAAIGRARRGEGPSYLEFDTYRWREHCGPNYDNDLGYRTVAEFDEWQRRCPITRYRRTLLQSEDLSESDIAAMETDLRREVEAAFDDAKRSPFPPSRDLLAGVYAEGGGDRWRVR